MTDAVALQGERTDRRAPRGLWRRWAILAALTGLALAVRLPRLDAFITPDEMKWVCRSANFYRGLTRGDLTQTFQTGHPGVITMWLGVPFGEIALDTPWLDQCVRPNLSDLIQESEPEVPEELAAFLFKARRGTAILASLLLALAVWLLARLFDWRLATLTGVLLALEPFLLAHSRFLHLDAIVTSLLFPSVLALLVGLEKGQRRYLLLSGALLGLAMLNKSPAMFGMGFAGLLTLGYGLWQKRPFVWMLRQGLTWLLPSIAVYVLLWPAMWVQPLQTLESVFGTAFFYASRPHDNSNYFLGAPRPDPGPAFYPLALAFRLTPWAALGALAGLVWWLRRPAQRHLHCSMQRRTLSALGLFVLLYGLFMTLGQKKFDRYLLPVFPFVLTWAAFGLQETFQAISKWLRLRRAEAIASGAALAVVLGLGLSTQREAPYFLTYYSPLLGGRQQAVETLLVGWGEGLDQAGAYLNQLPASEQGVAVSRSLAGFAPYYRGPALHQTRYDPATTQYVVLYLNEIQRRLEPALMERYYDSAVPLHVVRVKGIDYVWLYENKTHGPPLAYIAAHAQSGDAILLSRPSIAQRAYAGGLTLEAVDQGVSRDEILAQLQRLAEHHDRVWYLEYAEKNPNPLQEWLRFQWRTHARRLDAQTFTDVELSLWQTSDAQPFLGTETQYHPLNLAVGEDLVLKGYQLPAAGARWEHAVGLTLEWQVQRQPERYYACSIHVLDAAGHRVGQGDQWMQNEALQPTVDWRAGDVVSEPIALELAPGLAPGAYRLALNVYDRVTHEPLTAATSEIGELIVGPSRASWMLEAAGIGQALDEPLNSALMVRGYQLSNDAPLFGEEFTLTVAWLATAEVPVGQRLRLQVVQSESGTVYTAREVVLVSAHAGAQPWRVGESYWQRYVLRIPEEAHYGPAELLLTLLDAEGSPAAPPFSLASLTVQGHRFEIPEIPQVQRARLGEQIALLGHALEPTAVRPGEVVYLTLYWQALGGTPAPYTVFTHLLDEEGIVRGQKDSAPLGGRYPTDRWQAGEYVVDVYPLTVDEDAPLGAYRIEIGMYDAALTGAPRVALFDENGARQADDRLLLDATVTVQP